MSEMFRDINPRRLPPNVCACHRFLPIPMMVLTPMHKVPNCPYFWAVWTAGNETETAVIVMNWLGKHSHVLQVFEKGSTVGFPPGLLE